MTTFAMASTLTPPTSTAPRSAWILQDGPKRGVGLEISGQPIEATLPVELEEDLEIAITYGKSSRRTWVQRDLLYLLVGRRGRLRITRPGIDVATDTIAVHADEATARELATSVGATLVEARRGWLLNGPDVLYELAYTAIPPGKLVVQPCPPTGSADASPASDPVWSAIGNASVRNASPPLPSHRGTTFRGPSLSPSTLPRRTCPALDHRSWQVGSATQRHATSWESTGSHTGARTTPATRQAPGMQTLTDS